MDFDSLLSHLKELDRSKNIVHIGEALDHRFASNISNIITKWTTNDDVSDEEREFIHLYSKIELYFVQYYFFDAQSQTTNDSIDEPLLACIFRKKTIDGLIAVVEYIHDQEKSDECWNKLEKDEMLNYFIRMLDTRAFAYRLYAKKLDGHHEQLHQEIQKCLTHQIAKDYIYEIINTRDTKTSLDINNRHKFFVGCCTFVFASFYKSDEGLFAPHDKRAKYVCMLAKYIRVVLHSNDFEHNESIIYCLRGILYLLTNCIPMDKWIKILNAAFKNPDDEAAQLANPFNAKLFYSIVDRLLASDHFRNEAKKYNFKDTTSLVDVALIFINKWCGKPHYGNEDADNANRSTQPREPNYIIDLLSEHKVPHKNSTTAQVLVGYIDAKYDRLKLMAISTLSYIMDYQDFVGLAEERPDLAKDILKLIFGFMEKAENHENQQYKGITVTLLLHYLLQFLAQDIVKKEMKPYISSIVKLCKRHHLEGLRILRKISLSKEMAQYLKQNTELLKFLKNDASNLYDVIPEAKKIISAINETLFPESKDNYEVPPNADSVQAFISYSHENKDECNTLHKMLLKTGVFKKIWLDRTDLTGDLNFSIIDGIKKSHAFFALLSKGYCDSDTCRREWNFAEICKKKMFPVTVENFSPKKYDWTAFVLGSGRYYKINKEDDEKQLVTDVRALVGQTKTARTRKFNEELVSDTTKICSSGITTGWRKKPVIEWTSTDIQQWCQEKHLEVWSKQLNYYTGPVLLELHRVLTTETNLKQFSFGDEIFLTHVVLFKYELHKAVTDNMG